jgi:hypothetical protein
LFSPKVQGGKTGGKDKRRGGEYERGRLLLLITIGIAMTKSRNKKNPGRIFRG